jgi:hypothetical protein
MLAPRRLLRYFRPVSDGPRNWERRGETYSVAPAGQRVPAKGKERVVAAKFVTATQ